MFTILKSRKKELEWKEDMMCECMCVYDCIWLTLEGFISGPRPADSR